MKKDRILIHKDELKETRIKLSPISSLTNTMKTAHRDDHYMFIILQSGSFLWELDFTRVHLNGPTVCFVAPGQVHRYLDFTAAEGWLLFTDTELLSHQIRDIFEAYQNACQFVSVQKDDTSFTLVPVLIEMLYQNILPLRKMLIGSLMDTLTGWVAAQLVLSQQSVNFIGGQKYVLVNRFKQLLREKFKKVKQVKAYASLLSITPLYLNEVMKEITGFPASYWISQEILLEAKRILYYTSLDVKQIAYELGYEDHAYFCRFFKKQTGRTALEFRTKEPSFVQS